MEFRLIRKKDHESVTVFFPDGEAKTATNTHPNFERLKGLLLSDDPDPDEVLSLIDISTGVARHFAKVSDRVAIKGSKVLFDYEEIDSSLTRQILRFYEDGLEFSPLVNFFEKIQINPEPHSREQLYPWLARRNFTLTPDGDFIAYKSVWRNEEHGFVSVSSGKAIVNGQEHSHGQVPNPVGAVVEFPRSEVAHDPSQGCGVGLHAGSYGYASTFTGDAVLRVKINPRDVRSVPTEDHWAKLRVCRYEVLGEGEEEIQEPLLYTDDECECEEDEYEEFDDTEFTDESKLRNDFEEDDFEDTDDDESPEQDFTPPTPEELSQPDEVKLGDVQRRVLLCLNRTSDLTIQEVATKTAMSRDAAKGALYRLLDKGLVEKRTSRLPGRAAKFSPTSDGNDLIRRL